jgi:hypothetical protein
MEHGGVGTFISRYVDFSKGLFSKMFLGMSSRERYRIFLGLVATQKFTQ